MKKSILYSLFAVLLLASCRKSDNPKIPELTRVPIPNFTLDTSGDLLIQEPEEFKGKFSVDLYFKEDIPPQKMNIVVARNGDYSNLKVLKADVNAYPANFDITGPQLAELFGIPITQIVPGSFFEFGAEMTLQSGQVIPAFSVGGTPYGTSITNYTGEVPVLKFKAVCPLDLEAFVGAATISDPGFWEADYPVAVSLEGEDVLVIKGYVEDPDAVIKVKIDLKAQTASVPKQVFAPSFVGYTNGAAAGSGEVDACNNKIILNITHTVDQGSFGTNTITLIK